MAEKINRIPGATYRLQFNRNFRFVDAEKILSYLHSLGISDLYFSPIFLAGPESTHGYDVCQFDAINPNLGSTEEFNALANKVRAMGMGLLIDMVPNHMGSAPTNRWWNDVVKSGRKSKFAEWFDIFWEDQSGKVLLPVLGDRYGNVLRRGEIKCVKDGEHFFIEYFGRRFPLSSETVAELKGLDLDRINRNVEELHKIVQRQNYRLAYWRVGLTEMNYRKFFDVTELISIRVEDPAVFENTHRYVFELLESGKIRGLRIDHPDGLRDPKTYFDRLQSAFRTEGESRDLYVVAEKILSDDERLPQDWVVSGTTGYDFLSVLNGIFIARENEEKLTTAYSEFTGLSRTYAEVAREAKIFVLEKLFASELSSLTRKLRALTHSAIDALDFTADELRQALCEYISLFPVYRTYARADATGLSKQEETFVRRTIERVSQRRADLIPIFQFLEKVLLFEPAAQGGEAAEFVFRLQQLTGPATAKGLEDTAFYRYARFISLNEVGGNPGQFGVTVEEFHSYNSDQQRCWPHALLATATHDTKRGEDLRARLNVLSEMPDAWRRRVGKWRELNRAKRTAPAVPSANDEYLLYQTLAGSWSSDAERDIDAYIQRIQHYMEKASREAKVDTSWLEPNADYEKGTAHFIRESLRSDEFQRELSALVEEISYFGVFNSLSQLVLKICSPGVPDFYQGTELWDFNLVDPDNRRSVDYQSRMRLLEGVKKGNADAERASYLANILKASETGEVKMFVAYMALQFRAGRQDLFERGSYRAVSARGSRADHVVAFSRELNGRRAVIVVPRLPFTLASGKRNPPTGPEVWGDTALALERDKNYLNIFTQKSNQSNLLADILGEFPVAILSFDR